MVVFEVPRHLRMADFGVLHRNELSGTLSGLTRVCGAELDVMTGAYRIHWIPPKQEDLDGPSAMVVLWISQ
jgi:hypothetical protein